MLLMYRSRNNFVTIIEIVKNQGSAYFSKTEHENKSSTVFRWISAKETHQKPKIRNVLSPKMCAYHMTRIERQQWLHKLLSFSLIAYLFVKQESHSSLAGATNLSSKFL